MKERCKRMRKTRKEKNKKKETYWLRRKGELAEITNNAKRAPYQSFSSPTHRSPLCKFSIGPEKRKSAYYTHEPAVFYPESGRCTPRETDRENQMRGTLIVHALHLMNCRTKSTTKESENRLKSKITYAIEYR